MLKVVEGQRLKIFREKKRLLQIILTIPVAKHALSSSICAHIKLKKLKELPFFFCVLLQI